MTDNKEKFEFFYFGLVGRGEVVRAIFRLAKREFDEKTITFDDWKNYKGKMLLGQIPALNETTSTGTRQICQSTTIMRHLGRIFKLYGNTEEEHCQVDMVIDYLYDVRETLYKAVHPRLFGSKDETLEVNHYKNVVPGHLENFCKLAAVSKSSKGFLVNDDMTIADVFAYDVFDQMRQVKPSVFANNAKITAFLKACEGHDGFKAYLPKRSKSELVAIIKD